MSGREVLITVVVQVILLYIRNCFQLLESFCDDNTRLYAKIHWRSWRLNVISKGCYVASLIVECGQWNEDQIQANFIQEHANVILHIPTSSTSTWRPDYLELRLLLPLGHCPRKCGKRFGRLVLSQKLNFFGSSIIRDIIPSKVHMD